MFSLSDKEIHLLSKLLGNRITKFSSDELAIYPTKAILYSRKLLMSYKTINEHANLLFSGDFSDNENGEVIYNYAIDFNVQSIRYENAQIFHDSSPIKEIVVYGRSVQIESVPNKKMEHSSATTMDTDDLFHIKCEKEEFLIAFDPFLPQFSLLFYPSDIKFFIENRADYKIKHVIR